MNIVLIGFRGCGKTAVGRVLAAKTGRPFIDTDARIQARAGSTIREIVAAVGWPAFRDAERACVGEVARRDGLVISLGGGAVLDPRNVADLKDRGVFIWLTADAATIRKRLEDAPESADQRPPLRAAGGAPSGKADAYAEGGGGESGGNTSGEIDSLLRERAPVYRRVADAAVDTTRLTISEVAGKVMALVAEMMNPGPFQGAERS